MCRRIYYFPRDLLFLSTKWNRRTNLNLLVDGFHESFIIIKTFYCIVITKIQDIIFITLHI